ncbi:efflux RND transporter periplasmic adaptor subunit [Desulfonatronum parangueonense]
MNPAELHHDPWPRIAGRQWRAERLSFRVRILLTVIAVLMLCGCSEAGNGQPVTGNEGSEPVVVETAEVQPWPTETVRRFPGVVRPGRRATLSTRMSGAVKSIPVRAGEQVQAGDLLAIVESREVEAAIAAAGEQLTAAQTAHAQAVKNVQRLQRLYSEDLVARNRLEQAQVREQELDAAVRQATAELQAQRVNLDYANLAAPFPGIVSEVAMDEGAFVGPGTPIVILEDRSTLRIDVVVPTPIAHRMQTGESLSVASPLMTEPVRAEFVAVIPALEEAAVGQRLRLALDAPPDALQPGHVVDVLVQDRDMDGRVEAALPENALIRRGQLNSVLVVQEENGENGGHVLELRWISVTARDHGEGGLVPVAQGLQPGEIVVVNPSLELREGQRVIPERTPTR